MKRPGMFAALAMGLAVIYGAQAQELEDYRPLEAKYKLRGPTIIDPEEGEKKDRVAFFITGEAAARMYEAMHAAPHHIYICGDDDILQKKAGHLECHHYKEKNNYMCDIAIILDTGETDQGEVC